MSESFTCAMTNKQREKERERADKERKTCTAYIDRARDEWRHLAAAAAACGAGVCHLFVICDDLSMPHKRQENQKKEKEKKRKKRTKKMKRQSGRAREHFIKVSRDYQVDRLLLQLRPKLTNIRSTLREINEVEFSVKTQLRLSS